MITIASCLVDAVRAARNHTISEYLPQNDDIAELLTLARTISKWEDEIVAAVLTGVTNARSEALTSAIHAKVESSLIIWLSCGNTLKSPQGARTFWVRVTSSVSAGHT